MKQRLFFFLFGFLLLLNFNALGQKFKYFNFNVADGLPSPQVYDSYEDEDGYIWFTTDRGMCRYNGKKFETFTSKQGLENITNFRIYPTNNDHFWTCSIGANLSYWDGSQFHAFQFNKKIESLISNERKWLTIINIEENIISFFFEKNTFEIPDFFFKINISTGHISKLPFNQAKIGTSAPSNTKFVLSKTQKYSSKSDSIYFQKLLIFQNKTNRIISIYSDNRNNVYVGTYNGLIIYKNGNINDSVKILEDAAITSIGQSKSGTIIITTLGKGVFLIPSIKIHKFNFHNDRLENEMFNKSVIVDESIFFKSDKNIILELDKEESPTVSSRLSNFPALHFTLLHISNGDILHYITSYFHYHLLTQKEKQKNKRKELNNTDIIELINDPSISKNYFKRVLCAIEDNNNRIWIGTHKHLYYHELNDNSTLESIQIEKLPINQENIRISKLCVDPMGLWISTLNNGLIFRFNNGNFVTIDQEKLLSHTIHSIFLDGSNLFIATNRGLNILKYKIDGQTLNILDIQSINSSSGILSDYILDINKWHDKIWLTTNKGICYYMPNDLKIRSEFPNLLIKGLFVNNQLIKYNNLKPNESDLTIEYDAPSLVHLPPEKYRYKYRLDSKNWTFTNNSQVAYDDLESGAHFFEIQCSNLNGQWSQSEKIDFFIEFQFYKKTWFRALIIFLIILLTWIIILFREKKMKIKAEKELSYKEIELGMLRNQINPHFTFNSLNMIQNYIFANKPIKANEHLGKLSHLIRKGLELSRLKSISIGTEVDFITSYILLEKERFRNKFDFEIIILDELKKSNIEIPPLLTQPIIENILKHAFKKLNKKGEISVHYLLKNHFIEIIIQDNGSGFDISKNTSKQSLGLEITKRRIEILNEINPHTGSIFIHSQIDVGTRITLKLPIKKL